MGEARSEMTTNPFEPDEGRNISVGESMYRIALALEHIAERVPTQRELFIASAISCAATEKHAIVVADTILALLKSEIDGKTG